MNSGFSDPNSYRPPDRDRYLEIWELQKLYDGAWSKPNGELLWFPYFKFMANTGMRPSESNEILVSDIRFEGTSIPYIKVRTLKQGKKKVKKGGKFVRVDKVVYRDVHLLGGYDKELLEYLYQLKEAGRLSETRPVFDYSRQHLWEGFKDSAARGRLNATYTLYSLRHTRAIILLQETGGDIKYVQNQLGHSSPAITYAYLHCLPGKLEEYARRVKSL